MKRTIIYIIMCMMTVLSATAHISYRTPELQRLASTMRIDISQLHEGYNYLSVDNTNVTLVMQNGVISHIGVTLFSEEMRNLSQTPVMNFLERYFLLMKYPPVEKTAATMARDDQFRFEYGSIHTVEKLLPSDRFEYNTDGLRYIASWSRDDKQLLTVSFPVEYQLMSGENKIEAENHILNDISNTKIVHVPDNMDSQQSDHYMLKSCTNRIYFVDNRLVAGERYPAETVANMMLSTEMKGDVRLHITQVAYGFRKSSVDVNLKQWITFCRNSHCKLFFGIDKINNNSSIDALVIAVNTEENYNHVLTVSVPIDVIADQQGTIEARLYSYVPTQNLKSLFGAYGKSNPKSFVRK